MYHHCILCGVRIQPQPHPPERQLIWRSKIRAVTSQQGRSSVSLTGLGYLSEDFVRASDDSDVFYDDSAQVLKSYDLRHSDSSKPRTFAFHESCWQILLSQLESLTGRPQEPRRIAEPLFSLLFCLPRDRFNVSFQAHDFGGAFEICSSPKGLPGHWKFLLADPNAFRTYLFEAVHNLAHRFQSCSNDTQDCFSRFPLESFWASRFAIDKDMNFFALQEYLSKPSLLFRAAGYEAKTIQISVSFITFDCAEYFSGMRVFDRSGTDSITELSRAGVIMPYSEESIIIPPNVQLIGVQVASSISGIVGLSFLLQDGDGPTIQRTAGTVINPAEGVGVAALRPRVGHKLPGLLIGLDACKFVSLKLLELRIDPVHSKSGPSGTARPEPWYWHPAEPDRSDIATSLHMPDAEKRLRIPTFALDMNFGGTDGSRLSRLNRIVALHDDRGGFFRGIAFFYTDGSKEAFGATEILDSANKRWTCIEQSIALDGPGGERIVKLGFVRLGKHVQVVKMFTNHGRTLETITGILATAQLPNGPLESFGFRCPADVPDASLDSQPRPPQTAHTFPMRDCRSRQALKVLQNSNSCFTSVVLSKIRRIRVSVGIPGHVSGLCFEFWDSKVPVYVGQWFHEVRSLCVERGERITGFTFWQAQESHPNNADFDNSGRITGIKISKVTLGRKEIAFRFGGKDDMLVYSFLENSYERLSGLAWSFDHQCDYIYTRTHPRPGTSLMFHDITDSHMPGKLFWQFQDSKGNWLQVSGIHAFFIDRKLSGLVFEYGSLRILRQAGGIEGNRFSMKLEEGEFITRMDVLKGSESVEMTSSGSIVKFSKESVKGVTLHTNKNRRLSLQDVSNGYTAGESLQTYDFGDPHGTKTPSTPPFRATLPTLSERHEGTCVGIWMTMNVFPRATGVVGRVGPILQKKL
ncbi:F-box domain-containing protein [Fusarium sp. Ph1]|nr:F-box domain-containing protein [Fusarium sp. Ph1]